MSGIYIKGIEFPERDPLIIKICRDGTVSRIHAGVVATAIAVPDHGDLIDRGVLEIDAQKRLLVCDRYNNEFQKPYEVMRAIAIAPTIIPADKEDA